MHKHLHFFLFFSSLFFWISFFRTTPANHQTNLRSLFCDLNYPLRINILNRERERERERETGNKVEKNNHRISRFQTKTRHYFKKMISYTYFLWATRVRRQLSNLVIFSVFSGLKVAKLTKQNVDQAIRVRVEYNSFQFSKLLFVISNFKIFLIFWDSWILVYCQFRFFLRLL